MPTDRRTPGERVAERDAALRRTTAWTAALAVAGLAGTGIVALTAAQPSSAAAPASPGVVTGQGDDQGPALDDPGPPPIDQGQGQAPPQVRSAGS